MTELVIDSSAWIEYFRNSQSPVVAWIDAAVSRHVIFMPDLVYVEVMRGFANESGKTVAAREFSKLPEIQLGGMRLSRSAVENHDTLRRFGVTTRSTVDLMIGTWCMAHDVPLLHQDKDFDFMEKYLGLRVWRGDQPSPQLA